MSVTFLIWIVLFILFIIIGLIFKKVFRKDGGFGPDYWDF